MRRIVLNTGAILEEGKKPYIIAEIGSNHDGDFEKAKRMIRLAKEVGADAAKFQSFKADTLCNQLTREGGHWIKDPVYSLLKQLELPMEWHLPLAEYARSLKIDFLSTPFDLEALHILTNLNVPALKIASGDLTYFELIKEAVLCERPLFLSTGHATLEEVERAVSVIKEFGGQDLVLLHCVSAYPCPKEEMNVKALTTLKSHFGFPVGLSDHSPGSMAPLAAVALGAVLIEKHLTLSRKEEGPDHPFAMEPEEFRSMVDAIDTIVEVLGTGEKNPSQREMDERHMARRALYAIRDLKTGERLKREDIRVVRHAISGTIQADLLDQVIGRTLRRGIKQGYPISKEALA